MRPAVPLAGGLDELAGLDAGDPVGVGVFEEAVGDVAAEGELLTAVPGVEPHALLTLLMILVISGFLYLVSTFLFAFSGGQYRMVAVVNYVALIVIALMIALTAIVWKVRSPISATKFSAIGTPIAWVVAMVGEWGFSQFVFVTGAP